jgi:NAD(P)-dependent dehydrogenase (short-subunit alcohol dehydrogenase family)
MPAPAKDMAVIVTGAARGMGRAMTLALVSDGGAASSPRIGTQSSSRK